MTTTKKRSGVSVAQFLALIVATVAISLVVDVGRKVVEFRHLQVEEVRLEQEIEYEEGRTDYLEWLKERVQYDSFVGDWARREWKMVRPGETSVVPSFPEIPAASQASP